MAPTVTSGYYDDPKFAAYFECERAEMLDYIPESVSTILEVGCGAGAFGRYVKNHRSVEMWGIEPDNDAAQYASGFLDHVLVGMFPQVEQLPQHYFDCIVFNDVLEHMIDPWAALSKAKDYLTPDGYVVASVPNIRYLPILYRLLVRGEWTYTPTGALDKTHLRFFTKKSMLAMFDETGFDVLRIEGIYAYHRWQVPFLEFFFPRFVKETKHIDFAIFARPKTNLTNHV